MDEKPKKIKAQINLLNDKAAIEQFIQNSLPKVLENKMTHQYLQFELDMPTGELWLLGGTHGNLSEINSIQIDSWQDFYTNLYNGESIISMRGENGRLLTLRGMDAISLQDYFMQFVARTVRGKSAEILKSLGLDQVNISITAYEENFPPIEFEAKS